MNGNMEFRRARREEAEEILQLYRSLIGTELCLDRKLSHRTGSGI